MASMADLDAFYRIADLLREPVLLVDTSGIILGSNRQAKKQLGNFGVSSEQASLLKICSHPPEPILDYLRACSRSKSLLPGTFHFAGDGAGASVYRSEGALYAMAEKQERAKLFLRLIPKETAVGHFIALNQQITHLSREVERRRRAEEELVEQRERLRVTLNGIGDAVIATDVNGIINFMNPVAEAETGWPSAEAIGMPLSGVFRIVDEHSREIVDSSVQRVIREGAIAGLAGHTVLIRKDGTEIFIADSASPIRNGDGPIIGAVLVFHNISERRRLEQELERHTLELEEEHRRKDEFLAMLSHELRNPLAPMKAAVQILNFPDGGGEKHNRARAILERQVNHLAHLVDELLDVARISKGKIVLKSELVGVDSVISRAMELCEPLFREKRQQVLIDSLADATHVQGDLQRLTQVVGNLLNNAAKYTQAGGTIRISTREAEGTVEIAVQDNGLGIHPDVLPHVFDLFSQSERTLARSEGGLGVGLTLVQRIVEQHGGSVFAFSEGPGKGSEFRLQLPTAPSSVPRRAEKKTEPGAGCKGCRIMIVDDSPDACAALAELLQLLGHEVTTASKGEDAISAAALYRPDVMFLDIGLPGMDGYTVARTLRATAKSSGMALVALTGYGQPDDRKKTRDAGFDYHLVKPADLATISEILQAHSGRRQT